MNITDVQGKVKLSNGVEMPYLGLGVFEAKTDEAEFAVKTALSKGYRLVDTAVMYQNEEAVGKAVKESEVNREDIFITTKLWNSQHGFDTATKAIDESLERLQTDYADLILIHWPVEGRYKETWKALEKAYNNGKVKAIGVSNFTIGHLQDLMNGAEINPMVNQVEFHPQLVQQKLLDFCNENNIQLQAWSPIMKGKVNEINSIKAIAKKHGKSAVQVVLRWDLQKGVATIPKSVHEDRIEKNCNIFDFELSKHEMETIDNLNKNHRLGPDPNNFDF